MSESTLCTYNMSTIVLGDKWGGEEHKGNAPSKFHPFFDVALTEVQNEWSDRALVDLRSNDDSRRPSTSESNFKSRRLGLVTVSCESTEC